MRSLILALALAFIAWPPASAQQLLSPSEFRDAAIAMIRAADPRAEVEVRDELGVNVRRPYDAEMPEFFVNFDNAYLEYQNNPAALAAILQRWARVATGPAERSQMAERIVSVVRARAMVDSANRVAAGAREGSDQPPSPLIWRPFAGDLVEIIAFDGADTIQYATEEALADIGVTPERAWEMAPGNLPARLGELEIGGVEGGDRLAYVTGGNGLAPSTLTNICVRSTTAMLFLLVDRNGYVVAERGDSVAMGQFRDLLDELRRSGDALSLTPLGCQQGRVVEVALTD
jgi:hypothetical protein